MAKSKFTAMNLSSHVPTCSSSGKSPIAPKSAGIIIAAVKPESRMRGNSATVKLVKGNRGMWFFPNLKLGVKKM